MHTEESLAHQFEMKLKSSGSPPQNPPELDRPTRVTLDEVIKSANWNKSSVEFFAQLIEKSPAESEQSERGMSMQWCFLQLLVHGSTAPSPDYYSTSALFRASGLTSDRLRKLQQRIGGEPVKSSKGASSIYLTFDLAAILIAAGNLGLRIGNNGRTSLRHIVTAFIFRTSIDGRFLSYLDLDKLGLPIKELLASFRAYIAKGTRDNSPNALATWKHAVEMLDSTLRGRQMRLNRDAFEHEGCLDVHRYAEVLATLIRQADDKEFNLAIYGHWGRGKTFLMKRTAEEVRKPRENDPREVETIMFSAWQYPSRPEVWIHLYETFAKAAFGKGWFKSLPVVVRAGIARHGYNKLLVAYFLGVLALIPLPTKLELTGRLLWQYYSVVGLAGLLLTYAFYYAVKSTNKRLKAHYLTATRHAEKLGLQATIGDDLAALLKGLAPLSGIGGRFYELFYGITLFAIGTLVWRINHGWPDSPHLMWVMPASAAGLFGFLVVCGFWLFPMNPKGKKILLIVDDLDRCDPDHLLSVMESIKLLLENPEISPRVLVAMLVEEDILRHAIWRKYAYLADENAAKALSTSFNGERVVRENCEKLFTVHLRLPPLQPDEIEAVVGRFAFPPVLDSDIGESNKPATLRNDIESETQPTKPTAGIGNIAARLYIDSTEVTDATNQLANATIVLTDEERLAIGGELKRAGEGTKQIAPLGPRTVRAFIFRYQLTRLILAKRGITDWQPENVITALADALFSVAATPPERKLNPEVLAVIKQVT